MTRAITIRLDLSDYERLAGEARNLGVRPGTLAKVLLHSTLTKTEATHTEAAVAALDRLAALAARKPAVDVVTLIHEARTDIGEQAS